MSSYSGLADIYEYLIYDCDYEKWSQSVCKKIKKLAKGINGADYGCGTGIITRALKQGGFNVTGCDTSAEMLNKAVERSQGLGI